eukprot:Opistho-1_new@37633
MASEAPSGGITITVRLVKNFEYRTIKPLVLHNIDPNMTAKELMDLVNKRIGEISGYPQYRNNNFDTIKILHQPHLSKTNNTVINLDHDELILSPDARICDGGVINETELSFFNRAMYEAFKQNPMNKW